MTQQTYSPSETDFIELHVPAYDPHIDDPIKYKMTKKEDHSKDIWI